MSRETPVALGLIALAALYWLGADQIRVSRLEGIVGAQTVPKGLAVSLAVLSLLMIVQDLWRARSPVRATGAAESGPDASRAHLRAAGMLLIGVGYLAVVGTIGYVAAIALLVLATALYMGREFSNRLVLLSIGGALFYYLIFVRLLDIPLPAGVWPALWRELAG